MDQFPTQMKRLLDAWDSWEVQVLVLFSLTLQIILNILSSHRRYLSGLTGLGVRIVIWSAYVVADPVATTAISKLSRMAFDVDSENDNNDCKKHNNDSPNSHHVIRVLWAPILLLHLGGQGVIIAYSVADFQLWLRHALTLVVQTSLVIYTISGCWTGSCPSILIFPMFVAGITKYGERVWAQWSLKNSFLKGDQTAQTFFDGYFKNVGSDQYFEAVDIKLGLMYEMFYTKASILYSRGGCIAGLISFFCMVSVLLGFCIITKDEYSNVDVIITYVLLVVAVVLDIYAVILMLFSDWPMVWWMSENHEIANPTIFLRAIATIVSKNKRDKKWSNSMAQFNLLRFSLYDDKKTLLNRILKFVGMDEKFKQYCCKTRVDITEKEAFKKLMVEQVGEITGQTVVFQPFNTRGEWTLRRNDLEVEDFQKTVQVDFDDSIIIWHIATDFCCHLDCDAQNKFAECEISKMLSDYMMYLLVKRPHMLHIATWSSMFKSTCDDIKEKLEVIGLPLTADKDRVCKILLEEGEKAERRSPRSAEYPALWHASKLTKRLNGHPRKWNIISNVWIEMLCYAGTHCLLDHHVEELRRGGEFLTHIWLLLANFDLKQRSIRAILATSDDSDAYRAILDEFEEFDMSSAPMSGSESSEISIEIT